jgi:hypothetical protein
MIGYEDRLWWTREMPLGAWNREVEDETFVRVLVFLEGLCFGLMDVLLPLRFSLEIIPLCATSGRVMG